MALGDILALIESDARDKAKDTLADAEKQAQAILKQAGQDAEDITENIQREYSKKASLEKNRIIDNTRLDIKKRLLAKKQNLLSLAFQKSLTKLQGLPKKTYLSLVEKLLGENVTTGTEELVLSPKDKYLTEAFLQAYNKKHKTRLKISPQTGDFSGGFILKTATVQTACTFEALLNTVREDHAVAVNRVLFGEAL